MPDYEVGVPVSGSEVRAFLEAERARFARDLADVFGLITDALKYSKVYKIYGRGDKQDGELLKHPRKIKMKFNRYFTEKRAVRGSLWSIPDIIGFTVVVQYPSDITKVCAIIDGLVDAGRIVPSERVTPVEQRQRPEIAISTKHGRSIMSGGYFACHYNVRKPGVGAARPICEIQIKTVLHDAWGGKSHDLTYKPSGRTSQELLDSFNLLGDALAKIDQQSDLIRRSIERTASVRERKKRAVQAALIGEVARAIVSSDKELQALTNEIESVAVGKYSDIDIDKWTNTLIQRFEKDERSSCILLCLLANRSKKSSTLEQAQETVDIWFERSSDPLKRAYVKSFAALTSYSGDSVAEAIEAAEHGLDIIDGVDRSTLDSIQEVRLDRVLNSLLTSLAYYHADRIGSHDGTISGSTALAKEYLERSVPVRTRLGMLPKGLESSDDEIKTALADAEYGWPSFSTLDNEAFVRIQTADTEEKLRATRERMAFIHENGPPQRSGTTQLLFDYHDYCARARLAELESN